MKVQNENEKREKMLNEPVELLVCKMAVPTIITMLITAFYNMADTYFVGKIDTVSTAAVGLALPLMNIIQAIGFFFGQGSGNYMAHKLGEGDTDSAAKMSDTAVILSTISGLIMAVFCLMFIRPLSMILGAKSEELIRISSDYIIVLLIGFPFVMTSFTMNNQLRFQGNAFRGMVGMATGSILNVILDPIFIFVLKMGFTGAAVATVSSQIVSFIVLLVMSGRLPFRKLNFMLNGEIAMALFQFGTPSLFRQGIASVANASLNNVAGLYGEAAIAAASVVNRIIMLGASAVIGFGQGFQPVCGFNSGAKRYDRVHKVFVFCIKAMTIFMLCFGAFTFIFAGQLVAVFRDDPAVIEAGIPLLRAQSITLITHGVIVMTNMLMQNMGRTFIATFLSVARQGCFFIPLVFFLSSHFGLFGLQITQASADMLTLIVTLPFTISALKLLSKQSSEMQTTAETGN